MLVKLRFKKSIEYSINYMKLRETSFNALTSNRPGPQDRRLQRP